MMGIMYVKSRCIGDQYQSIKVVTKGERMIRVVFSKAGSVRCVSSKILSYQQLISALIWNLAGQFGCSYMNASADSIALVKTFSAAVSSK